MPMKHRRPADLLLPGEELIVRFSVDDADVTIEIFNEEGRRSVSIDPSELRQLRRFLEAAEAARIAGTKKGG